MTNAIQFLMSLNPVKMVLQMIEKIKMILRMILKWIDSVTGVFTAVKKVEALVKKGLKTLQRELKEITVTVKEANKLKPA